MKTYLNTNLLACLALILSSAPIEARTHHQVVSPRTYQFSRPRDPFDMVSDIFSMPVYVNSLMKQHNQEVSRLARSSDPRYRVLEDPKTGIVELEMELPGVKARDLDIELENGSMLRVKGSRKLKQNGKVTTAEFDQLFELDKNVDPDRMEVSLSDGILSIRAPKREKTVKKLQVATTVSAEEDPAEVLGIENGSAEAEESAELGNDELQITTEEM